MGLELSNPTLDLKLANLSLGLGWTERLRLSSLSNPALGLVGRGPADLLGLSLGLVGGGPGNLLGLRPWA